MQTQKSPKKPLHNYAKFSALAFQTGIIMFGFAYGGIVLDDYLDMSKPLFTLALSLVGIALALYLLFKDLLKPKQ